MKKTKWREQIDMLEVGESDYVKPSMQEKTFRTYIYGNVQKWTGKKFSINKQKKGVYLIIRKV